MVQVNQFTSNDGRSSTDHPSIQSLCICTHDDSIETEDQMSVFVLFFEFQVSSIEV